MKILKLIISVLIVLFIGFIVTAPAWFPKGLFFVHDLLNRVPAQRFYILNSESIDGIKVWELKNLNKKKSSYFVMSYMMNKKPETREKTTTLCKELIEKQRLVIKKKQEEYPDTEIIKINLYLESEELPKYYIETYPSTSWARRDIIEDHIDELVASIQMNLNYEITDIRVFQ